MFFIWILGRSSLKFSMRSVEETVEMDILHAYNMGITN